MLKNKEKFESRDFRILAVDFDGTLAKNEYPKIGEANIRLISMLSQLREQGKVQLILYTCRVDPYLQEAIDWCKLRGLEFDAINDNVQFIKDCWDENGPKPFADWYLDDKSFPIDFDLWRSDATHPSWFICMEALLTEDRDA